MLNYGNMISGERSFISEDRVFRREPRKLSKLPADPFVAADESLGKWQEDGCIILIYSIDSTVAIGAINVYPCLMI